MIAVLHLLEDKPLLISVYNFFSAFINDSLIVNGQIKQHNYYTHTHQLYQEHMMTSSLLHNNNDVIMCPLLCSTRSWKDTAPPSSVQHVLGDEPVGSFLSFAACSGHPLKEVASCLGVSLAPPGSCTHPKLLALVRAFLFYCPKDTWLTVPLAERWLGWTS